MSKVESYMITVFGYSTLALGSSMRVAIGRGIESALLESDARDVQRDALATGSEVTITCRLMTDEQIKKFERELARYHDKLDRHGGATPGGLAQAEGSR